jgi:hypothetical protein
MLAIPETLPRMPFPETLLEYHSTALSNRWRQIQSSGGVHTYY